MNFELREEKKNERNINGLRLTPAFIFLTYISECGFFRLFFHIHTYIFLSISWWLLLLLVSVCCSRHSNEIDFRFVFFRINT